MEIARTVTKNVAYPFQVNNNIRDLKNGVQALATLKRDVTTRIEKAKEEHADPTEPVLDWVHKVEIIEAEAKRIMEDYQQMCRSLWNHSADMWSNYKISKRAAVKQAEVERLCKMERNLKVTFTFKSPPPAHELPASTLKSPYLQSVLDDINKDEHNIIGIVGIGGMGKTHLLVQVHNELCRDRAFDVVIFVTCSQHCSEEKVQDTIISKLGLDENPEQKQSTIYNFLKGRSFVLLLEDLWSRVDLCNVGIPDLSSTKGACKRKVILTTRLNDVCRDMKVEKCIEVKGLNADQAWFLFVDKVTEETLKSHPLIRQYAQKVVECLHGWPLALITVGGAMHDKRNLDDWENAVTRLQQPCQHGDIHIHEWWLPILSFSYEKLSDTLKNCFLHCSLWPENHCIMKEELVELWMGLGLIDEPKKQLAYNVGYSYITQLQQVCLLEEGEDDGVLGVKLNAVIHLMAQVKANGGQFEKWIVHNYNKSQLHFDVPSETDKLSLVFDSTSEISFGRPSSSPKLSTLLLTCASLCKSKFLWLELFLGLTVLDLSRDKLIEFPVEICKLVNLQFLNLSKNCIRSLPAQLADLINLRYLLLRQNLICSIPNGILSKLKALRVLDLCPLFGIYVKVENSSLMKESNLVSAVLEEMKSNDNFQALGTVVTNMEEFEKLTKNSNVPVRWLEVSISSEQYSFTFPESFLGNSQLQANLFSLLISIYAVYLNFKGTPERTCSLGSLEQLIFSYMYVRDIIWDNLKPKDVFPRLQILEFHCCKLLTSISWVVYLPCLQELRVSEGHSLKQLINEEYVHSYYGGIDVRYPTFPSLRKMVLRQLDKLEKICDSEITFPALEKMRVERCQRLKKLPFKADNIPSKLRMIESENEWWDNIEDISIKYLLQPSFYS